MIRGPKFTHTHTHKKKMHRRLSIWKHFQITMNCNSSNNRQVLLTLISCFRHIILCFITSFELNSENNDRFWSKQSERSKSTLHFFLPLSGFISKDFFKVLFKLKILFQNNCKVFKIGVIILQPAVVNGSWFCGIIVIFLVKGVILVS